MPVPDPFETSIQKRNARKAIECFDEAAELDDPRGCLNAAIFYQKGLLDGVPQLFKSWQLFRKGITLGDILCMVNVAKMYDSGVIQNLGDGISTKVLAQDYRCNSKTRQVHQHFLTSLRSEAFKHYRMAFEAGCDDSDVM